MSKEIGVNFEGKETVSERRVVVTGLGIISPLGLDVKTSWQNLIAGKSGVAFVNIPGTQIKVAGVVNGFDPKVALAGFVLAKDIRRISRSAQFSLASAIEACKNAGLFDNNNKFKEGIDPTMVGVAIGTGLGGAGYISELSEKLKAKERITAFDALLMEPERVASVPSMKLGAKGPLEMISAACASGNRAIADGYKEIYLGDANIMIVGGAESVLSPVALEAFFATGALVNETDPKEAPRASKPFDRKRKGFVISEGAGILILEEIKHARERGVKILAELVGYGNTADAGNDTDPSGEGAKRAMDKAIKKSGGFPQEGLIYVQAHGTGTQKDAVEIDAIREAIIEKHGNGSTAVSSIKGATGHLLGAAGALSAIFCIKAMEEGVLPPTINLDEPMDEAKGINLVPNRSQSGTPKLAVVNSFGFGGINTVTVWKRGE